MAEMNLETCLRVLRSSKAGLVQREKAARALLKNARKFQRGYRRLIKALADNRSWEEEWTDMGMPVGGHTHFVWRKVAGAIAQMGVTVHRAVLVVEMARDPSDHPVPLLPT